MLIPKAFAKLTWHTLFGPGGAFFFARCFFVWRANLRCRRRVPLPRKRKRGARVPLLPPSVPVAAEKKRGASTSVAGCRRPVSRGRRREVHQIVLGRCCWSRCRRRLHQTGLHCGLPRFVLREFLCPFINFFYFVQCCEARNYSQLRRKRASRSRLRRQLDDESSEDDDMSLDEQKLNISKN